jgi:hypothetical protein
MSRRSQDLPAWRAFGAALGAFAIGAQLLLSGLLVGHIALASDQAEFSVICSHDPAGAAGGVDNGTGAPSGPQSHDQCPACACPQAAQLFAPPPASPRFTVLRPRSQRLVSYAGHVVAALDVHSPYASRAPPHSA